MNHPFHLNNKTALITGASGGIGSHIAKVFVEAGAKVVITGTRKEVLDSIAQSLNGQAIVITANLGNKEDIQQLVTKSEEALGGKIDILVNNAGVTKDNLAMRMKDEEWETVINLNLNSNFYLTRAVLKTMVKQKSGTIINIASVVGQMGNPGQLNYSAAKAGLIGMTKTLAKEMARWGIRANCIAPGFIETAMTDKLSDTVKQTAIDSIPLNRMGTTEEIALSTLFLASDAASYITGHTLQVNGGIYI